MKAFILVLLFALGAFSMKLHREGIHQDHFVEDSDLLLTSHIFPTEGDVMSKYQQIMNSFLQIGGINAESLLTCSKGDKKDYFKVGGNLVGRLGTAQDSNSIELTHQEDDCFDKVTAEITKKDGEVEITFTPSGQGKCAEVYLLATTASYNVIWLEKDGKPHSVRFRNLKQIEIDTIEQWGIHIFRTCDSWQHLLPSLLQTIELFFGGFSTNPYLGPIFGSKPAPWMVKSNVEFIERATGFSWRERNDVFIDLNDTEVQSGDFISITRFDGVDQIIQYGSGSHSGHSAVILEVDGEMVVVESQDGWYWPKHGIQRNKWNQWKKWARNAGFNVAVLPLSPESRQKFDLKKAEAWFKKMEGFPYGYHNFVFGWVDTAKQNFPPLLDGDIVIVAFSILEKIVPAVVTKFVGEAFNMRLGTKGLNMEQLTLELAKRNLTWGDMFAQVERDEWVYSDGPSMVCSAFAAGIYKAAGLFGDLDIQATEFTPKDVYTLFFFDKNATLPQKCVDADPDLPYCQIMGYKKMDLPGYATINPYTHMCETCPTMAPDFFRPDGC